MGMYNGYVSGTMLTHGPWAMARGCGIATNLLVHRQRHQAMHVIVLQFRIRVYSFAARYPPLCLLAAHRQAVAHRHQNQSLTGQGAGPGPVACVVVNL